MELGEAIKNLKAADRFKALIILAVISSGTAIATMYFKTDDCKGIADQYESLVRNNVEIMKTNNSLIEDNNTKTRAIMHLDSILVAMSNSKPITTSKTEVTGGNAVAVNETHHGGSIITDDSLGVHVLAMERPREVINEPIIVKKTTTTTDMSAEQKNMLGEALKITKEFKNKQ